MRVNKMASKQNHSSPPHSLVMDVANGFVSSKCLFVACELGLFDLLKGEDAKGLDAPMISEKLRTNLAATNLLLDTLVCLKFLTKHQTSSSVIPVYKNTTTAEQFLVESSPSSMKNMLMTTSKITWPLISHLESAVRDGCNASGKSTNDNFFSDPSKILVYLEGMRGYVRPDAKIFITSFDLSIYKTMCDLGGGTGDIGYAACTVYPNMQITIVELPPVVQYSSHFRPSLDECPNQSNVSFVAVDFFKEELPAADLYVLTHIMHNWGDEKIDTLLTKVYARLPSGGAVLIGESVLNDDKTGPLTALVMGQKMLVHSGGRERSATEYKEILERHGFADVQVKITGGPSLDALLAKKL